MRTADIWRYASLQKKLCRNGFIFGRDAKATGGGGTGQRVPVLAGRLGAELRFARWSIEELFP
jgi:hypothetical protein